MLGENKSHPVALVRAITLFKRASCRQDFTNDVVKVTWLAADLLSSETHQLTALNSQVLVGAAHCGVRLRSLRRMISRGW